MAAARAAVLLWAVLLHVAQRGGNAAGNTSCANTAAAGIDRSCAVINNTSARQECAADIITKAFQDCFTNDAMRSPPKVLHVLAPSTYPNTTLTAWAQGFRNQSGAAITFDSIDFSNITAEVTFELKANVSSLRHDGWILDPAGIPVISDADGFEDLGPYVANSTQYNWTDVQPFFRDFSSVFGGKVVTLPLDGDLLLMYYRRDVFEKFNLSVPATWEDFLAVATAMNGTDFNGDGVGDYGVCLDLAPLCKVSFWVAAIAAPYIQYQGVPHGLWFDPATMQPLANNSAMRKALDVFKGLAPFQPPNSTSLCAPSNPFFDSGHCLMTLNWGDQFKIGQMSNSSKVRSTMAVAPLPGSTEVLDRKTGKLVPCTPDLCVYAEKLQTKNGTMLLNRTPYSAFGGWAAGVGRCGQPNGSYSSVPEGQTQDGTLMAGGRKKRGTARASSCSEALKAMFDFFAYISGPEASLQSVLDPASTTDPFRKSHLNLSAWVERGYGRAATQQYLAATEAALSSPNVAQDIRFAGALQIRGSTIAAALQYLSGQVDLQTALNTLQQAWQGIADGADPSRNAFLYREAIGYRPPPPTGPQTGTPQYPRGERGVPTAAVVVPSVLGGVLLVALVVVGWVGWRARALHRTWLGRVTAPGMGPDSTLVVTSITDSTTLWELLPPEMMEASVKEHHQVVRKLLLKHNGYESATEGDSFILAFHSAQDAVLFGADLQLELMKANWPQQLLDVPVCQPRHVVAPKAAPTDLISKAPVAPASLPPCSRLRRLRQRLLNQAPPPSSHPAINYEPLIAGGPSSDSQPTATFREWLWHKFPQAVPTGQPAALLYRGLQVRVGVHSGISSTTSIAISESSKRTQYSGDAMSVARAVVDAAQGAMVLLSEATYQRLRMEEVGQQVVLLQCGTHKLNPGNMELYQVVPHSLIPRLAHAQPIRSDGRISLSALQAPTGSLCITVLKVAGLDSLLAWDAPTTHQALALLRELASQQLLAAGGYQVEGSDEVWVAAFPSARSAATWAVTVLRGALSLNWPGPLLNHPLGEPVTFDDPVAALLPGSGPPEASPPQPGPRVLLRGLRLKCGLDCGALTTSLNPTTGRIVYHGRAVQRAGYIAASIAASGQVICTEEAWSTIKQQVGGLPLEESCRGSFQIPGTPETLTLFQCR